MRRGRIIGDTPHMPLPVHGWNADSSIVIHKIPDAERHDYVARAWRDFRVRIHEERVACASADHMPQGTGRQGDAGEARRCEAVWEARAESPCGKPVWKARDKALSWGFVIKLL